MTVQTALALVGRDLPVLRLMPAPASDPPYDDEGGGRPALRLVPPAAPAAARAARTAAAPHNDEPGRGGRTPTTSLPGSGPFAHALVQRLLEVCAGVRPLPQLRRDTTPELYDELEQVLNARPRATGLRPTRRDIFSVHVQDRPDGVAEVCATVRRGNRAGALALRLEGRAGRWTCTELAGL